MTLKTGVMAAKNSASPLHKINYILKYIKIEKNCFKFLIFYDIRVKQG